jgi:hypothetical protein
MVGVAGDYGFSLEPLRLPLHRRHQIFGAVEAPLIPRDARPERVVFSINPKLHSVSLPISTPIGYAADRALATASRTGWGAGTATLRILSSAYTYARTTGVATGNQRSP